MKAKRTQRSTGVKLRGPEDNIHRRTTRSPLIRSNGVVKAIVNVS